MSIFHKMFMAASGAGVVAPTPELADPYFDNVELLLHGDGTSGSTTFTDSSPDPKTFTVNGNTQIDTAVKKFGTGSIEFDGTGDYLELGSDFGNIGASGVDYTIETWIYMTAWPTAGGGIFAKGTAGTTTPGNVIALDQRTNEIRFHANGNYQSATLSTSTSLSLNTWYHVAVSREGDVHRLFLNGVIEGSTTQSYNVSTTTNAFIGTNQYDPGASNRSFYGYMDDFRVTKGVARYTTDFNPPDVPHPDIGSDQYFYATELLIPANGTSGSTNITDSSSDPKTITVNGNAQIDTAVKKFGTGSIEFDGTNSELSLPSGLIGSGDFTIEYFVQGVNSDGNHFDFQGTNRLSIWYEDTTTTSAFEYSINAYDTNYRGQTNSLPWATYTGAFNHIAIVRSSGTIKIYINGTSIVSWSNSSDYSDATLTIGNTVASRSFDFWMEGYLDDVRITDGVARYTSDFNPPDVPHPDIGSDQYFYATELLIPANGTNGSTTFTDESSNGLTITANGNAQISTTQSKFGGSSAYFDGSGDYLSLSASDAWGFGDGAWTIEFFINTTDTDFDPIAAFNPSAPYEGWGIRIQNGLVKFFQSNGTSSDGHDTVSGSTGVNDGAWHHVALTSASGSNAVSCYIDGTLAGSHTFTVAISTSGQALRVGADTNTSPSRPLNGYIDDLRITKGVVRYTSDFNSQRIEHPDFGATREAVSITANGNAQISTAQSKFGGSSAYFDGTGDYLTASHASSFNFGSGDFTAEVWFNSPNVSGTQALITTAAGQGADGTDFQGIWLGFLGGQYYFVGSTNGTSWNVSIQAGTPSTNTWTLLSLVRSGNTFTLYVNGTSIGTTTNSGTFTNSNNLIAIGGRTRNSQYSIGYLDEVRISNTARYTSNFTAPTSAFDNDSNTLLLLHMDNPNSSTTFIDDNGLLTSTE